MSGNSHDRKALKKAIDRAVEARLAEMEVGQQPSDQDTPEVSANKRPKPKVEPEQGLRRVDWMLYLMGAAVALVLFLSPRTPTSTLICSVILFLCLLHPALYLPYVMNRVGWRRILWRSVAVFVLLLATGTFGLVMFREVVQERDQVVSKSLSSTWSDVNPKDARATAFSVVNESGVPVFVPSIYCHINEGYANNYSVQFGGSDFMAVREPQIIESGNDARTTQCLRELGGYPILDCVDLTLIMPYVVNDFPRTKGTARFRFVMKRVNDQFQWARDGVLNRHGACTGSMLQPFPAF